MGKIKDTILKEEEKRIENINENDIVKIVTNNGNKYETKVKNILQYNDDVIEYKADLKNYQGDFYGWKIVSLNMINIESIVLYHNI